MTVTDCWKAYTYALPEMRGNVTLREFADQMSYDLINNKYSCQLNEDRSLVPMEIDVDVAADGAQQEVVSPLMVASFDSIVDAHNFGINPEMTKAEPGTGKPCPRHCTRSEPGCTAYKHFCCQHYKCMHRKYKVGNEIVYGWFYCQAYWTSHWKDGANGTAG